ncbi:hypothetical protein Tco_0375858 [Tanacetum coccineum]
MIAPGSSRYSSNDMVHNHYLEEAKKKTQESCRNSEPSVMPSARSQSTANSSKPKPRINNQKSRNWPASKSSCVTTKTVPIAEHSRNSRSFSDYKHFVCSTCQKCVFNANHDSCVTKFLNEVNSRAKVPSHKTTTRYKPVEQTSFAKKPERQIPKRHRSSIKKTSVVHEKTMTPRSGLRWKPTGKIFKTVGLRWVPTGKIFTSSTTKVDSEPQNGSNADITNQYESAQTLDVSAGLAPPRQMTSDHNSSELEIHDHSNDLSRSKLVLKVVPPADKTATSRQELELLFHHHITMLRSTYYNHRTTFASGEKTPKPKYVQKKADYDTSPKQKPVQATKGTRIKSKAKVCKPDKKKQPAKKPKAKGLAVLSEFALTEAEQLKLASKRSKKDFHILHANGSSDRVDTQSKVPDEQHLETTGADEGTGTIPRAPDVPIYESESEKESWGDSEDEDNENDSDDISDEGDNDNNGNNGDEYDANDDDKQEGDDTNDDDEENDKEEEKIDDEEMMDEEEEDDEVTKELYDDVNVNLGNEDTEMTNADQGASEQQNVSQQSGFEQEEEDAHVTLTLVLDTQKSGGPTQSSFVFSDFASKLLNLNNPSLADNEIASLMDTTAQHAIAILEITSSFTITIPPQPPSESSSTKQSTPTPTPTLRKLQPQFLHFWISHMWFNSMTEYQLEKDLSRKAC